MLYDALSFKEKKIKKQRKILNCVIQAASLWLPFNDLFF